MTQSELHRAVSRATGETVDEVARRGFGMLEPLPPEPTPEALIARWHQAHPWRRRGRRRHRNRFSPQQPLRAA